MSAAAGTIQLSVIIPVGDRFSDPAELYADYRIGLDALGVPFECIFVLDGQRPLVTPQLRELAARHPEITLVGLSRSFGEAGALMVGFQHARGDVVLTLPAYFQIEGAEIPTLVNQLESADLVVGHRWPRVGGWLERARRGLFHRLVAAITGVKFSDLGCGARAMRREVLEEISLYGDQHRFLPLLADRQGFRVSEVRVRQSAGDRFQGSYRARDYAHRGLDIVTVFFLVRFTKKPLRFFGMAGVTTFAIGAGLTLWMIGERVFLMRPLAGRPLFLLSSLFVVLGLQLIALGLLGELIIFTHAREQKDYQVAEIVHFPAAGTPQIEAQTARHT
ncbi:MAG: glycosyltransferase [Gammaproteobacteria bacterium]